MPFPSEKVFPGSGKLTGDGDGVGTDGDGDGVIAGEETGGEGEGESAGGKLIGEAAGAGAAVGDGGRVAIFCEPVNQKTAAKTAAVNTKTAIIMRILIDND